MLLVASETGHVYTFATPKLQPMITSEAGKALIQTCLHQPDQPVPPTIVPTTSGEYDIRMSAAGYEETDLGYNVSEEDFKVVTCTSYVAIKSGKGGGGFENVICLQCCSWLRLICCHHLCRATLMSRCSHPALLPRCQLFSTQDPS